MDLINQLQQFQKLSGSLGQMTTQTAGLQPALSNKFTPSVQNANLVKTQQAVSQLTSKLNEIDTFINNSSIAGGDQPFSIVQFAKEFVTKQSQQPTSSTDKTTNTKPITKKLSSILEKQSSSIAKTFLQSQKIISVLDKNVNKILKQNNVSYVSVENGQIIAQPIQNEEINKAITNIQIIL